MLEKKVQICEFYDKIIPLNFFIFFYLLETFNMSKLKQSCIGFLPVDKDSIAPTLIKVAETKVENGDASNLKRTSSSRVVKMQEIAKDRDQKRREQERIEREKRQKKEQKRKERERKEKERLKAEKLKAEKLKFDKIKAEKVKAEKLKLEKVRAEKIKAEKLKSEKTKAGLKNNMNMNPVVVLSDEDEIPLAVLKNKKKKTVDLKKKSTLDAKKTFSPSQVVLSSNFTTQSVKFVNRDTIRLPLNTAAKPVPGAPVKLTASAIQSLLPNLKMGSPIKSITQAQLNSLQAQVVFFFFLFFFCFAFLHKPNNLFCL